MASEPRQASPVGADPTPVEAPRLQGEVGLADLLILRERLGAAALDHLAPLAGLARRPPTPQDPEQTPGHARGPTETEPHTQAPAPQTSRREPPRTPDHPVSGLPFYRVVDYRPLPQEQAPGERPQWAREARPIPPDGPRAAWPIPVPAPLSPWRRLWPFLRAVLGERVARRTPDLRRLIRASARGRMPRRIPHLRRARWTPRARVVLDFNRRTAPLVGADLRDLVPGLLQLRGALGLEVLGHTDGLIGPWIGLDAEGEPSRLPKPPRPPHADMAVLVVGDLGCTGGPEERAPWVALGHQCRRAGIRPVALVTCPSRAWHPELAALYRLIPWDRGRPLPRILPRRTPRRISSPAQPPDLDREPLADLAAGLVADPATARLLDHLTPAAHIEPALLRALRCRLGLDIGAELGAWHHPHLTHTSGGCQWRDAAARAHHEPAFRALTAEARRTVAGLLTLAHLHQPESLRLEEAAHLARLEGRTDTAARDHLADLVCTVEAGGPNARNLLRYMGYLLTQVPAGAWQEPRLAALFALVHRARLTRPAPGQPPPELPPGLDLEDAAWLLAGKGEPRVRTLVQQGRALFLIGNPALVDGIAPVQRPGDPAPIPGSPLGHLVLSEAPVQVADLGPRRAPTAETDAGPETPPPWRAYPSDARQPIPIPSGGLILRGHDAELTLASLTRPHWASAIGQDGSGLSVDIPWGAGGGDAQGTRRLRWVPPGPPLGDDVAPLVRQVAIPRGAWWDQHAWARWRDGETLAAAWADARGVDEIGPWADFSLGGVTQRMRWIWPGEFTMGSPEGEVDRIDNETLHPVLLTTGYWLAETACTQALWEAVMGQNPSRFSGAERPVEQVSWEDVMGFLARLAERRPGLAPRLPTEAEWEHACRGGRDTPFGLGANLTTDQVNYDGDYPYAGAPKGQNRGETVPVKQLAANDWGLYQMHGNVWEWCSDCYGDYGDGLAIDHRGAATGVQRVCRGGSWIYRAERCRSAQRVDRQPDERNHNLGFRLARGPEPSSAEPPGGGAPGEGAPGRRATPDRWSGAESVRRRALPGAG